MSEFISGRIIKEADKSLEKGQEKYRAYFINTTLYLKYKANTDTILEVEGYGNCIVSE